MGIYCKENEFLWVEKYRPNTLKDVILPERIKKHFTAYVESGEVPNLILSGTSGVGKTTVAKAMLEDIGCDYMVINGSKDMAISDLRTTITDYASSLSINGGRKYIIIDEGDYISAGKVQPALRNFMEEYSRNCGFIITCNYISRIMPALRSRSTVIDFTIQNEEKTVVAKEFFSRVCEILDNENVSYKKDVVAKALKVHLPDWRRLLNDLQAYSDSNDTVDSGVLSALTEESTKVLMKYLKSKTFKDVRQWAAENASSSTEVFSKIYNTAYDTMTPESVPPLVVLLAEYQDKASRVADQEINLVACLTEIMMNDFIEFR